jgi:uncharacterized protein
LARGKVNTPHLCKRPCNNNAMSNQAQLSAAIQALALAAPEAEQIVLFGSHARGDADAGSDYDFLVIEPTVSNRAREMVRLRRALRPLRLAADILVYSREEVTHWGHQPGTALYWALKEGRVVHG